MLRSKVIGHSAMLMFSALVAFSFTFGKLIADEIDPSALTALRFVIALVFMLVVALFVRFNPRQMVRDMWRWVIVGGCMAVYFNLMFVALRYTTPLATSAVFTLTPLIAAGFGFFIIGASVGRTTLFALLVGALGALWVIFRGDLAMAWAFEVGKGEAIFFFGAAAHAAVPALRLHLLPKASAFEAALGTVVGAVFVSLLFALPTVGDVTWHALSTQVWLVALYLGIVTTALTSFFLQVAVQRLTPGKVMAYTYIVPAWVLLHAVALGQRETPIIYVGVALTFAALFILLFSDERPAPQEP